VVRIEREGISARLPARFALVALDEGADETETLAPSLADRLGLRVALDGTPWREADMPAAAPDIAAARRRLPALELDTALLEALCGLALSLGRGSMRVPSHLARAARAAAALRGAATVDVEDAATAIRLVLGLTPAPPGEDADQNRDNVGEAAGSEAPSADPDHSSPMDDMLLEAVEASVPRHVLDRLRQDAARARRGMSGKAGATIDKGVRGRVVGAAEKPPVPNARLDVLATLRQAARWQGIRGRDALARGEPVSGRPLVRKEDFRYARRRERAATTALFVVDASGSAAIERLAETKGAIELLLAECYVRRDSVGLIAFRGGGAEILLEPTRSLVRAKRCQSALPGGGATPLASGIVSAMTVAGGCARRGQDVVTVFLTDGRGNVGLDGKPGREHADADTAHAARLFRGGGFRSILFDTGQRAQPRAEALARDLGAEYLPLPRGGSHALSREIGARMAGGAHG
jgi:magnesium chelatase subunit D